MCFRICEIGSLVVLRKNTFTEIPFIKNWAWPSIRNNNILNPMGRILNFLKYLLDFGLYLIQLVIHLTPNK